MIFEDLHVMVPLWIKLKLGEELERDFTVAPSGVIL